MKHTKEQLAVIRDAQVDKELELLLNPKAEFIGQHYVDTGDGIYSNVIKYPEWPYYRECPAYCRDVSEIMPLAFSNRIAIIPYVKSLYIANCKIAGRSEPLSYFDKNPLRAIVCCLILVLQNKQ